MELYVLSIYYIMDNLFNICFIRIFFVTCYLSMATTVAFWPQLTTDLTSECTGASKLYPLLDIDAKMLFYLTETGKYKPAGLNLLQITKTTLSKRPPNMINIDLV